MLAVWFVALVFVDASFLTAAANISEPTWLPPTLAIAAIVFVPMFLICAFVMQTKFRPQLQDDPHYSEWLERHERIALSTDEAHPELTTPDVDKRVALAAEASRIQFSRLRFELVPSSTRVAKDDGFSVDCVISGLGDRHDPTLGGFTLVALWNVYQIEFRDIAFGNELGEDAETMHSYTLLQAGVFNPSDPEFAAIVFSHHTFLDASDVIQLQSATPRVARLSFVSRTDGPIRLNAGFPYAQNSLLDAHRRPTLQASVSALFLNQEE